MQARKLNFGKKELTCKLDGNAIVEFERVAKKNPIKLFMTADMKMDFPRLGELLTLIHCSATRLTHNLKMQEMPDLFDEYCDNGGDFMDLLEFAQQLIEDAGFFGKKKTAEESQHGTNISLIKEAEQVPEQEDSLL
ncbi:hypothetical protein IW492_02650 [Enterococcus sp. BWB1-3]|uniref:DUF6096 family protein n=1 Tax=Enterococcus sp. BWB1-3 TaxID=2787713 RepID=UPI001924EAFB|nr:DUF6096 family protein [Enterococcus sp. BWB1-3]MBL1228131.1 hypothetical protein [Enterococcus sp. BWB1-3]